MNDIKMSEGLGDGKNKRKKVPLKLYHMKFWMEETEHENEKMKCVCVEKH